ncbi:MAG TPA: Rrf2 family transcriptional regulator [Lacipirellulaceae bacterium]|nr:Rrf2 family transcriptional regulator [Lacipirellulaceae bacterium]
MKLSRTIAYGIHATVQLARSAPGVPIPCSQLARQGHMPERFLVQILRCLVTHGILESSCGVAGGYSLTRSPAQITLRDIVEAFDSPLEFNVAALNCIDPQIRSRIVVTLQDVASAARRELQKLTVADLMQLGATPPDAVGLTVSIYDGIDLSFI